MLGEKKRCPICHKKTLIIYKEKINGLIEESIWDSLYQLVFCPRRVRYVCTNKDCKDFYKKDGHHKFIEKMIPGTFAYEHWWDDALKTEQKSKNKSSAVMMSQEEEDDESYMPSADGNEDSENEGQDGESDDSGESGGAYHGGWY